MRGPQWHFLFPKGFRSYADQHPEAPFCPWPVLSELPDFPMRTVYSGSDLIWSAEFSWVWGVFLTLGLLFVVLNILFRFPLRSVKRSRKHHCLLLLPCVSPIVLGKP